MAAAWRHQQNLSMYDALYVALAGALDGTVVTADGPLSRAPSLGIPIRNVRI